MRTSTSGDIGKGLVVDANALMAALLGGRAMDILLSGQSVFFTVLRATWEVQRHIPALARKLAARGRRKAESELEADLKKLPVEFVEQHEYEGEIDRARGLLSCDDRTDIELLALALRLDVPLWSNDRHFDCIKDVAIVTTAELLALLGL